MAELRLSVEAAGRHDLEEVVEVPRSQAVVVVVHADGEALVVVEEAVDRGTFVVVQRTDHPHLMILLLDAAAQRGLTEA